MEIISSLFNYFYDLTLKIYSLSFFSQSQLPCSIEPKGGHSSDRLETSYPLVCGFQNFKKILPIFRNG